MPDDVPIMNIITINKYHLTAYVIPITLPVRVV